MKLFVGLGNPGDQYTHTRHNVGFLFLEFLSQKTSETEWESEKKWKVLAKEISWNNEKVLLLKPQTYMNRSGESVGTVARFFKINPADIWLFTDDADLPFGEVRYREKGSAGGHNGLTSVFDAIGTTEISRIKFGIKNDQKEKIDTADFVLSKFSEDERSALESLFKTAEQKIASHWKS